MIHSPSTLDELRDVVAQCDRLHVVGGGSKPCLSGGANVSTARLDGVVEYNACEYTVTAKAGTPLADLQRTLAEEKQYLPFDPPLAAQGATIGGTVAAGLSGPGALRHGVLRDFLLGVRFVTGDAQVVFGGGKVVKNAAGFDFPKLMAGALGELGVLAELTFKVFPLPGHVTTLAADFDSRQEAVAAMRRLALSPLEPACLDLEPAGNGDGFRLFSRLAGSVDAAGPRARRAIELLGASTQQVDDERQWSAARDFAWLPPGHCLCKVGGRLADLLGAVDELDITSYRLSLAGHVLWLAWPNHRPHEELDRRLSERGLAGIAIRGGKLPPLLGRLPSNALLQRVQSALDPQGKLSRLYAAAAS
ncbi:MAG: FAD-binding protein [Planctomycetales bacterium]|nr:FAD-binding protein [Planctomycetales bacterium]